MRITSKINTQSFERMVDYLIAKKKTFDVSSTGYTQTLKIEDNTFTSIEGNDPGGFMAFPYFKKVKSDIEQSGIIIDAVPFTSIKYYSVGSFLSRRNYDMPTECIYIDIRSAYLTTLLNTGLITIETFDMVSRGRKIDRLKAVGMLATNKTTFHFIEGELKQTTNQTDKVMANYFFFCCFKIGEIMNQIAEHYNDDFLFFWFDGIYLRPGANPTFALETLEKSGYKYHFEHLKYCIFETHKRTLFFCYTPEGESEAKQFNVPLNNDEHKNRLVNYLKTKRAI